jgi:hypothetical protein
VPALAAGGTGSQEVAGTMAASASAGTGARKRR